jgi:8-amino-7-oxononanoate synthase
MGNSDEKHGFDLRERLREREAAGLRRDLAPVDKVAVRARTASDPGGEAPQFDDEALIFAANNYLGLAGDSQVADAAERAAREIGTGAGASRLIVGDTPAHRSLERSLAEKKGTERALAFSSGYAANVGTITALDPDVIFSDELNHASIIDGVRLSGAEVEIYDHCDSESLADAMATRGESASTAESWLVVVPERGVRREIRGYHRNSRYLRNNIG